MKTISDIGHTNALFSFACVCATLVFSSLLGLSRLQAATTADVANAATLGDIVSIAIDGHCLADNNGTIAAIDRKSISANALWRSVKDEQETNTDFRRYQNIATGNWLRVNTDNKTLSLEKDQANSSVFTHSWTTDYDYSASGTATGTISWTNQQTTLSLAYSANAFTLSANASTITFEQWHYYKDAKDLTFTVALDQAHSPSVRVQAGIFDALFPFADWAKQADRDTQMPYLGTAANNRLGYEEQYATFNISPTLKVSSYYASTAQKDKIITNQPITYTSAADIKAQGVSFALRWGRIKGDGIYSRIPAYDSYYNVIVKDNANGKTDLKDSKFDETVYQNYYDLGGREILQYEYNDQNPLTFTVKPIGRGPANVCQTENYGKIQNWQWGDYKDSLFVDAKGVTSSNGEQKVRIGRQSWNMWTEHWLFSQTTLNSTYGKQKDFDEKGGTMEFSVEKAELALGIGQHNPEDKKAGVNVFVSNIGGYIHFVENPNHRTDVKNNVTYKFTFSGNGESWVTPTVNGDKVSLTIAPLAESGTRSTEMIFRIKYQFSDTKSYYTYDTITITQTNQSGQVEPTVFIPNRGKGYAVFKDGRQQVHTYETTLYYAKGEDITLDLKEPNMFGYMRWYDYNTGRDPQYYTEADGTVRTLANFWKLFPYGRKDFKDGTTTTLPDVLFSSFNEGDAEHSKGVYFLIPEDYRNVRFGTGQLPSPIIHLDEDNLELDIACDVSNYTDYEQVSNLGHLKSFTEPTLSYRQIFHIRPAIEMKRTIADSLAKHTCKTKTYYEEYTYTVPVGTEVDLQTKYQLVRANGAKSDMHYWVKMADGTYDYTVAQTTGITTGKFPWWYRWNGKKFEEQIWNQDDPFNVTGKGNYYNDGKGVNYDFFRVKYDEETTMQWAVWIVPGEGGTFGTRYTGDTIWLAHFTVTWSKNASGLTRDTTLYGPSAKPLITKEDILRDYIMLSEQNFDFDEPGTTETTLYPQPLPAEESTFGFVYPYSVIGDKVHRRNHSAQKPFADYGEYAIINRVGEDENYGGGTTTATNFLLPTTQHTGGPADGYCLYVDGAKVAGKVVSLSTKAKLCSGQRMYCAMWLCNPTPSRTDGTSITNPDFRIDVEGRKDGGEWTVVESYEVGELNNSNATRTTGGLWRQIRFPLVSTQDFDESRITLYNYAATNNDNDFLVDDVWLYASRLPMEAFQTNTACVNDSKNGETMAAVIRMDYTKFEGKLNDKNELCYQVFDKTENKSLNLNYLNHTECTSDCDNVGYYGSLTLPVGKPEGNIYNSLQEFLNAVAGKNSSEATNETDAPVGDETHIGYVQITETIEGQADTRYILYIAEVLDASTMNPRHEYEVRAAYAHKDLANPQCAMRTPLPIFERTAFLFNGETYPAKGQCANERYPLEILVRKDIVDGDRSVTLSALARGEWLQGFAFDDIYYKAYVDGLKEPKQETEEEKKAVKDADEAFAKQYGYTRDEVRAAIADMRREPTEHGKTNFGVTDFHQLNSGSEYWDNQRHYAIIMDLCHRGLLRLAMEKEYFYLHSRDAVRYWIFPTARTAKVTYNGEEYTLNECATPTFVNVFTNESNYDLDLGVDRKLLQNGQVPRLRLTQSEANTCFSVPVTAIGEEVVLGWDSTQICSDGTTDPVILKKIEDHDALFSMRYTQDRIYTELADKTQYYKAGQMVKFTPIDAQHVAEMKAKRDANPEIYKEEGQPGFWKPNSDIMRAGYEYTLQLQMTTKANQTLVEDEQQGGCPLGYSYITLVVVPDTLIWTPTHYDADGYYHWGEDENWRGYSNGKVSEVGYAPLASSMVIIPSGLKANQYPYIAKNENRYPADANYNSAVCRMVQFRCGAHVLGQENLTYEKAFVDMAFPSASWNTLSAPLQSMYSGDLFIPHSGKYSDKDAKRLEENKKDDDYSQDFIVSGFQGMRTGSAAYAFWASYYNQNVNYQYTYGGDVVNSTTAAFVPSNALNEALLPGHGFAAAGWGLSDNETLEIRLPKTEPTYSYYDKQGKPTDNKVSLDRTNAGKLAYTLTTQGENTAQADNTTVMQVTLTNAVADGEFLLGNPTMTYLDVFCLLEANSDILETNHFRYIKNNTMETYSVVNAESEYALRFIEPMQSVLLTPKNKDVKELIIKIPRTCLSMTTAKPAEAETPVSAPRRAAGHTLNRQIMNIIAYNANGRAKATLAAIDFADNGYRADEDVIFISSGVEAGVGGNRATTPMNIYTLAGTQPLAIDIREEIGVVPLGFVIADNYRSDSITLYFGLNNTWESECYLCDNLTGTRRRIYNDSRIRIATPANHQLRYYIQGPQRKPTNPDTPTDINDTPVFDTHGTHVSAFSNAPLSAVVVATDNIVMVDAYDMAGRQLLHLLPDAAAPICNLSLPSGVALLRVTLSTGLTAQTKVIVR